MQPSRVRDYVLKDHVDLRARLDRIEAKIEAPAAWGPDRASAVLAESEAFLEALLVHMEWENLHLTRALREADAWGPEREERLRSEHREQRETLTQLIEDLRGLESEPELLARRIADFIDRVREDMVEEESSVLDPNVLRDDVVAIDLEAG
jgi:hemerythrin-like domain-containing protein